ncbi:unnamed protein product [Rhizoctonia solani]|uniref:Malate dehydrogenase n=2 Tax=Rhizoctonia solani TaxID=456999 RepID=A0A8H2X259_9AGAM|nr:putative malate dehydrogenase [Rhizoctonia solani 123E]CAE6415038.1 unnamed protein product [Rhizoctonia solani]
MFFSAVFTTLVASTAVLAVPTSDFKLTGCSLSKAKLSLPSNQTVLTVPSGTPVYVALGVGVQNYTCGSTGTFTSAGAVAKLFDLSCFVNKPIFSGIQDVVFAAAGNAKGQALVRKIETILKPCPVILGDHYFIPNPAVNGTGLTPVFDFRAGVKKGDPAGFAAVKKLGNTPSPAGSSNVDWLMLQNIGGDIGGSLANTVMRVDTKGGQPPASCTLNATISVPYAAKYWMYK